MKLERVAGAQTEKVAKAYALFGLYNWFEHLLTVPHNAPKQPVDNGDSVALDGYNANMNLEQITIFVLGDDGHTPFQTFKVGLRQEAVKVGSSYGRVTAITIKGGEITVELEKGKAKRVFGGVPYTYLA